MLGAAGSLVILLFAGVVEYIAMPSLAGLLIVVGVETVKPANIQSVWKTGGVQASAMTVTLVLTLLIPLQFAVLVDQRHLDDLTPDDLESDTPLRSTGHPAP